MDRQPAPEHPPSTLPVPDVHPGEEPAGSWHWRSRGPPRAPRVARAPSPRARVGAPGLWLVQRGGRKRSTPPRRVPAERGCGLGPRVPSRGRGRSARASVTRLDGSASVVARSSKDSVCVDRDCSVPVPFRTLKRGSRVVRSWQAWAARFSFPPGSHSPVLTIPPVSRPGADPPKGHPAVLGRGGPTALGVTTSSCFGRAAQGQTCSATWRRTAPPTRSNGGAAPVVDPGLRSVRAAPRSNVAPPPPPLPSGHAGTKATYLRT